MACAKARFFRGGSYAPKRRLSTFCVPGSVPRRSRARTAGSAGPSAGESLRRLTIGIIFAGAYLAPHQGPPRAAKPRQRVACHASAAAVGGAQTPAGPAPLPEGWLGPDWESDTDRARGAGPRHLDSSARRAVPPHADPRLARVRRRAPRRSPRRVPQRPLRRRPGRRDLGRARARRARRRRRLGQARREPGSRRAVRAHLASRRHGVHAVLSPRGDPARPRARRRS